MAGRGKPGSEPLHEKRAVFIRLVADGTSLAEASRQAGVHATTGRRWFHGRVVVTKDGRKRNYASVVIVKEQAVSARFLSEAERVAIGDLRREGKTLRQIAVELGRSPSTICRELRRNRDEASGEYRPYQAHGAAHRRRRRPGRGRLLRDVTLSSTVQDLLLQRWSPEQISHQLRLLFPNDAARWLAPETIYQAVYRAELGGLHRLLPRALHTGRVYRRRRTNPEQRRGRMVNMVMITERPPEAADRSIPGSWEGDLILGRGNLSAMVTLVERSTRTTLLLHLGRDRSSERVREAITRAFSGFPPELRRSLTWDQGKEMAQHAHLTRSLDLPVYFCAPGSPWQRPSNENTNGLLRHFFPKSTDLDQHTPADLDLVAQQLNNRPRKTLDWATPAGLLNTLAPGPITGTIRTQIEVVLRR